MLKARGVVASMMLLGSIGWSASLRAAEPGPKVFKLRVVDAETGKPVPKADVRLWMALRDDDWRKTDDQGQLEITYATGPDDRHFGVDAWGDGFAMQRHHWGNKPGVPVPEGDTVRLKPGESLGGRVEDEEGKPVAGAAVYLWSHNYKKQDPRELLYDLRAITGPDGVWHTGGAPKTTGALLGFYITHPDYVSDREYISGRERPTIEDLRAGKAVSVVRKGVAIEGRVLDADGHPVAGALVISTQQAGNLYNGLDKFIVRTDAEGNYRTGQVVPGEWHVVVKAKGHAPAAHRVRVGDEAPRIDLKLGKPKPWEGRVVDPSGKPIEGAFVNIDTWNSYRCLGVYLYTDSNGRFRWDDAPEDTFLVNVSRQGYLSLSRRSRVADEPADFPLAPALSIQGYVRDAETRKLIPRANIEYGRVEPGTGDVDHWIKAPEVGSTFVHEGVLQASFAVSADAYKLRVTADGYRPTVSRAFRRDEISVGDHDFLLAPGDADGPKATVFRPDGRPLAEARIVRSTRGGRIGINDEATNAPPTGRGSLTGPDGSFSILPVEDRNVIAILGDDCFAFANSNALSMLKRLEARPYARIEGIHLIGTRPVANRPIELNGHIQDESTQFAILFYSRKTVTDVDGRFAFEKVIPMDNLRVGPRDERGKPGATWTIGEPVRVEDGQSILMTVGGKGRPVVGRVEAPEGWGKKVDFADRGSFALTTDRPNTPYPLELFRGKTSLNDLAWSRWSQAWPKTPEGRLTNEAMVRLSVQLTPDGSFRIEDVPAGEYRATILVNEESLGRDRGPFEPLIRSVVIPPMPEGRSDEPYDLGVRRLRQRVTLKPGDPAPPFEVTTVDGHRLSIPEDYRGKYLLLDFGTMWDDQSRLQVVRMNEVWSRFGKDQRFAILSLILANDRAESRDFVAEKDQPWPQAIVGALSNPIASAFGAEIDMVPPAILIGPDGRIIATGLYYQKIGEAIGKAMEVKAP